MKSSFWRQTSLHFNSCQTILSWLRPNRVSTCLALTKIDQSMISFIDDFLRYRAMWSIHIIPGMLSLITFFNTLHGTNQVAVSVHNTCVLSGTNVSCWGDGGKGILGTGSESDMQPPTSPIDLGDGFLTEAISCGAYHCCGVSTNKTLKCWGNNEDGQLGQGDINNRGDDPGEMGNNLLIVDLGSDFDVEHVSCGNRHTCALSTNYSIKCFGYGQYGQLGYGNTDNIGDEQNEMGDDLSVISLGTDFIPISVECGGYHSCALSVDHQIKCWGLNFAAQLGKGDTINRGDNIGEMGDNLTSIDLGTNFTPSSIRCGGLHVCALSTDHDTKCWGRNVDGQLGLGDSNSRGDIAGEMGDDLPVLDMGTDFVPQLLGGGSGYNLALSANGTIKAWGNNMMGALGYGDTRDRGNLPNQMGDNLPLIDLGDGLIVTDISSGCCAGHSCVFLENGVDFVGLKCWGINSWSQLGLGDTNYRGDEANEMGDHLPFIPLIPTPEPSMEPTSIAICQFLENCVDCLDIRFQSGNCLWSNVDAQCHVMTEQYFGDEDSIMKQSLCPSVISTSNESTPKSSLAVAIGCGILLVFLMPFCVCVLCYYRRQHSNKSKVRDYSQPVEEGDVEIAPEGSPEPHEVPFIALPDHEPVATSSTVTGMEMQIMNDDIA